MSAAKDIAIGINCPHCDNYQLVKSGNIPLCRTIECLSCETRFNAKETMVSDVVDMLDKFI